MTKGNNKLGKVWCFSLPAVKTCPGRTPTCERECYARSGRYRTSSVINSVLRSLDWAKKIIFVALMITEIRMFRCPTVRIHVSGDFYSARYVRRWMSIAKKCPETRFYAYTRSWRVPEIRDILEEFSKMSNVQLFYSADRDSGKPTKISRSIRIAYLISEAGERVPHWADLVFRTRGAKKEGKAIRINGVLVCPMENGRHWDGSCEQCGLCLSGLGNKDVRKFRQKMDDRSTGRIPLRLAV